MNERVDARGGVQPAGRGLLLDSAGPVRADAVRNAARILEVASRLVEERGAECVTMDAVAEAASVGKGTIFRRFESRAGLMAALMNHTEAQLQEAMIFGPPPLGPGAPPRERLFAFGAARLELVTQHGELMRASAVHGHPAQVPAFDVSVSHVRMLLREAGVRGELDLLARHLLNALEPAWTLVLLEMHGYSTDQVRAGWEDLVRRVLDAPQPEGES